MDFFTTTVTDQRHRTTTRPLKVNAWYNLRPHELE